MLLLLFRQNMNFIAMVTITIIPMLINVTSLAEALEIVVIEEDFSPEMEAQDMAKATALVDTFFWRSVKKNWDCADDERYNNPEEIGKNSMEELKEICVKWEKMAKAANAYVKNWRKRNDTDGEMSGNESKPRFLVELGELLLSSAMEAIKAVYRDLFCWGPGNGLKIEINFANEGDFVLLQNVSSHADEGQENALAAVLKSLNKLSKAINKITERNDYIIEFSETILKSFEHYLELVNQDSNNEQKFVLVKQINAENVRLWEIAEQLGLDWSSMCEIGQQNVLEGDKAKEFASEIRKLSPDVIEKLKAEIEAVNSNADSENPQPVQMLFEKILGLIFAVYKNSGYDTLMPSEHGDQQQQFEQLLVMDPCEKAKLKVKKQMNTVADTKTKSAGHKADGSSKGPKKSAKVDEKSSLRKRGGTRNADRV